MINTHYQQIYLPRRLFTKEYMYYFGIVDNFYLCWPGIYCITLCLVCFLNIQASKLGVHFFEIALVAFFKFKLNSKIYAKGMLSRTVTLLTLILEYGKKRYYLLPSQIFFTEGIDMETDYRLSQFRPFQEKTTLRAPRH